MNILLVIHIIVTVLMIGIILLQKSEGGGLGSSSNSGSAFSARGAANLLTRTTSILATLFMALCIVMTIMSHHAVTKDASIISEESK
ncbi:MAG: preprotein translocase subunit SecG [Proteobacteria bacterium]|nr:preprotein translocase subunit SecG [Pseudomonadota bacterium]